MVLHVIVSLVLAAGLGVARVQAEGVAPESLEEARKLYASAAYDEALGMLERVKADNPPHGMVARRDLEATRALCLLALGREREARQAMEAVVFIDPQFEFDERDAAPRVRALLEETRAKRLPQIIRQRYSEARRAYDSRRYEEATARFDSVLVLLDDPVLRQGDDYETMQDFALLAREFHGLSTKAGVVETAAETTPSAVAGQPGGTGGGEAAAQPATADSVGTVGRSTSGASTPDAAAAAAGAPTSPSAAIRAQATPAGPASVTTAPSSSSGTTGGEATAGTPSSVQQQLPASQAAGSPMSVAAPAAPTPSTTGSATAGSATGGSASPGPAATDSTFPSIVAPLALEQPVPAWSDDLNLEPGRSYQATVEVVIDEVGRVTSARVLDSINPVYDARLVEAVRRWRYRPGTRADVPVRFTKLVTVTVEAR
jgi:TonB family protein